MSDAEKQELFKSMISPDTIEDSALTALLTVAKDAVLNRLYPLGYPDDAVMPTRYDSIQVEIAIELWNHRGAEGQISHSENGISRSWDSAWISSALLSRITPMVGSVVINAQSEP